MKTYHYFFILIYLLLVLSGYFFFISPNNEAEAFFSKYKRRITFEDSLNIKVTSIIPEKNIKVVVINDSIIDGKHHSFYTFDGKDDMSKYFGLMLYLYKKSYNDTLVCTLSNGKQVLFKVPNLNDSKYPDWW